MTQQIPESNDTILDPTAGGVERKSTADMSRLKLYTRRFSRSIGGMVGLVIFVLLVLFAIFGGMLTEWDHETPDFLALSQAPGGDHILGTNQAGNDTYAQVVHGLQRSMIIAVSVSALTTIISAIVGTWAAFVGGKIEKATLAMLHFLLVVPSFLILALVSNYFSGDWRVLILILTVFGWVFSARVIWALATSLREREYITAARFMGVSQWKIVTRHMIPNIGSLLIINFTLGVVATIFSETGLSFLGFGVKPPDVSLGTMLADGSGSIYSSWWLFVFPSIVLVMLTVSMALIGDGLRDALDPNSKAGGRA